LTTRRRALKRWIKAAAGAAAVVARSDPSPARTAASAEEDMPMSAYRSNGGTLVPLAEVRLKPGWQSILLLEDKKVKCFVDLMQKDCEFAPIQVQEKEGGFYFVLDGHHRFVASQRCSFTHIPVDITPLIS
jgi:ParB-like nuclease family protein